VNAPLKAPLTIALSEGKESAAMKKSRIRLAAGSARARALALGVLGAALAIAPGALAQDQSPPQRTTTSKAAQQNVLQIGEITIVGRVQKPIAAVDVAKIQPKLTLAELRQPFLDRIEEAVRKDPF
jgi:hypothetical protein